MSATIRQAVTLSHVEKKFATNDACLAYLVSLKWPDGARCPRCESAKVYKLKSRPWKWQCKQCAPSGYRFSPLVGTIFENTNVPLPTWFRVIFLMTQSKKGISALQIHRMIGCQQAGKSKDADKGSYRTAWYMCHRIRAAMQGDGFTHLTGEVEIDETYIGGRDRNRHHRKKIGRKGGGPGLFHGGKVGVIGAIARKGNVTARIIERLDVPTVSRFVHETVSDAVTIVATDDHNVYHGIRWGHLRSHQSVNHTKGEYVRGSVHTANLDSFWSLLKRGVVGTFHKVSKDYLPLYLNEFTWRHNNRRNPDIFRDVLAAC